MSWLAQDTAAGVHILPLDDSLGHSCSVDCACQPLVELVDGPSKMVFNDVGVASIRQYVRQLVTHSAWDGRPE